MWIVRLAKLKFKELEIGGRNFIASAATATEHLGIEQNIYCDDQGQPL